MNVAELIEILSQIEDKYDKITIAVCYPEVFWDIPNLNLISLVEGQKILKQRGETEEKYSVYHYMENNGFQTNGKTLVDAFKEIYLK